MRPVQILRNLHMHEHVNAHMQIYSVTDQFLALCILFLQDRRRQTKAIGTYRWQTL